MCTRAADLTRDQCPGRTRRPPVSDSKSYMAAKTQTVPQPNSLRKDVPPNRLAPELRIQPVLIQRHSPSLPLTLSAESFSFSACHVPAASVSHRLAFCGGAPLERLAGTLPAMRGPVTSCGTEAASRASLALHAEVFRIPCRSSWEPKHNFLGREEHGGQKSCNSLAWKRPSSCTDG